MNELTIKKVDTKREELYEQIIDMAQLKSDFDAEKFTAMKKGPYVAHQFHMIMRQYSLALYEGKRCLIDREKNNRKILALQKAIESNTVVMKDGDEVAKDLQILELENGNYMLELTLKNQLAKINNFEKIRLALIEKNGGKAPTNEQYQKEEPDFWRWELSRQALDEVRQRNTGITKGVFEAIQQIEATPVIDSNFQRQILRDGQVDVALLAAYSKGLEAPLLDNKTEEVKEIENS